MRVLGVDPGYDRMGIAVVEGKRECPTLVFSTCVETSKAQTFSERLFTVTEALREAITTHKPDAVAVEEIFFSKNQKTAMLVAHVRGAILYLVRSLKVPIAEYNPSAIKIAVTGEGRAEKQQVIDMTKKLIEIPGQNLLDDEYDAIAVAITHLVSVPQISTRNP